MGDQEREFLGPVTDEERAEWERLSIVVWHQQAYVRLGRDGTSYQTFPDTPERRRYEAIGRRVLMEDAPELWAWSQQRRGPSFWRWLGNGLMGRNTENQE